MTHACPACHSSPWRAARLARDLTLEDLARDVGSTAGQLSLFERGRGGLRIETLLRLCERLGFDAGELPELWRDHMQRHADHLAAV